MGEENPGGGAHRAWAHLRFSIVGSLLAGPPPPGGLKDAIADLAARTWQHPTDPELQRRFAFKTIERWYYEARNHPDPVGALTRRVRSDAGKAKVLRVELLTELARQYGQHPSWSYKLHADNLAVLAAADPDQYGPVPSYTTVRRAMKRRGWRPRRLPRRPTPGQKRAFEHRAQRESRGYEVSAVHALWHLDFHEGRRRVLDARGEWRTPVLLGILDDRSRLCCHLQWYFDENTENLVHGLVQAICKRGLPRAVMHDNGGAMIAAETVNGLLDNGIVSEPTLAYCPEQNGKQEFFWGVVEGRLMKMLEKVDALTLSFLNQATAAWIEGDYNHKVHEEIETTPVERMLAGPDVSRPAPELELLRRRFTRTATRTQRPSDGTVSIEGVRFELPSRLRTTGRPTMRWCAWDLSTAWVVDPRTNDVVARVRPVDKERNAAMPRRALEPVSDVAVPPPDPDADPLPPLMRKLLADFAETGLPPAYLPKDETEPELEEDRDE